MSVTAQRRDIYDPEVITEFAKKVRDEEYLEYLVCLTVADICATNPELWNSWKRTLLAELFYSTQRALRRGLENPVDVRERIRHNQHLASALLRKEGFNAREIEVLWQRFKLITSYAIPISKSLGTVLIYCATTTTLNL